MCSCSLLCSLAEEEIKAESDVVEGMDASVRSKGKSLKASLESQTYWCQNAFRFFIVLRAESNAF